MSIQTQGVSVKFGGVAALSDVSITVEPGAVTAVIGPNGSGKSTLVNCICGTLQNEQGEVHFDGASMNQIATLRTATSPTMMAMTMES